LTSLFLERELSQSIARNLPAKPKSALRATLLASREAQGSQPDQAARNEALAKHLATLLEARSATSIGFYWPVAAEFDARASIAAWLASDASRIAALPVVAEPRAPLVFHAWTQDAPMKEGRYRIPVPAEARVVIPELLLIPCVGFDTERYRLGYGGGYYDRTLAAWPASRKPVTIGVAFEALKCDALPREGHDLPLDCIVTERAVY
jgi:5-formyltetrahydrofolate cyclo-ligase